MCEYDVILTDQDIVSQLKEEDCLMELDTKKVSNYENVSKKYQKLNGDGALYGIPALWGIAWHCLGHQAGGYPSEQLGHFVG